MLARLSLRGRSLLFAGAVVLPVLARVPVRDPAGGQAHTALAQELVACAVAALVAFAGARAGLARRDTPARLVWALVALEALSAAVAPNPWLALRASGLLVAGLTTFLAARAMSPGEPTTAPLAAIAAAAVSVVLEGVGFTTGWSRSGHAPGGLLGERNAASELLVCGIPYVVSVAVRDRRSWMRAIACATLGVAAAAVMMTRTRSAWLALGALAILGVVLALRTPDDAVRARAEKAAVAVAVGLALVAISPQRLAWTSAHPYRETLAHLVDASSGSGAGRIVQYATTCKMALAHPVFGVGPGNWAGQYLAFARPGDPTVRAGLSPTNRLPSSDALGFVAERGLPAAALAIAIAVTIARGGDRDRWLRRATLLAVLVVSSLDAVLQLGPHLLLVAWILGTAMPPATEDARGSAAPLRALGAMAGAAAVLASCRLAAFVLFVRAHDLEDLERAAALDRGNVALRLSVAATWIESGRCDRALPHLEEARRFSSPSPGRESLVSRCSTDQSVPRSMRSSSALLDTPSFSYRFAR